MKLEIFLLIAISGIILTSLLQEADSQLESGGKYLLQGSGFVVTQKSIENSEVDLQFITGKLTSGRMKVTIDDGSISLLGNDYLVSTVWTGTTLSNGRFLSLSGDASNINGEKISLRLFGRLVENSQEGSVYGFTGKLTKDGESMKLIYSSSVVGSSNLLVVPEEEKPKEKIVQVNILAGASKRENIKYYSINTVEITPGTTVIWKNDDTVPHTIMSGVASFSHGKPFKPDGKINSGSIAPGQTFNATISEVGITRFFDSLYSWMDGVIVSLPDTASKSLKTTETTLEKAKKYQ